VLEEDKREQLIDDLLSEVELLRLNDFDQYTDDHFPKFLTHDFKVDKFFDQPERLIKDDDFFFFGIKIKLHCKPRGSDKFGTKDEYSGLFLHFIKSRQEKLKTAGYEFTVRTSFVN